MSGVRSRLDELRTAAIGFQSPSPEAMPADHRGGDALPGESQTDGYLALHCQKNEEMFSVAQWVGLRGTIG